MDEPSGLGIFTNGCFFVERRFVEMVEGMPIIIWGTGLVGLKAYTSLHEKYKILAWGDSDVSKQGLYYKKIRIMSIEDILTTYKDIPIVMGLENYLDQAVLLESYGLSVKGYFDAECKKVYPCKGLSWDDIGDSNLSLYAGDLNSKRRHQFPDNMICLSLSRRNFYTIQHDIRNPYPLPDDSVDFYQSEDVFEHIEFEKMIGVLDEIYRILSPLGRLRCSLPDYYCPEMKERSFISSKGEIVFDPFGGGKFVNGQVSNGGHVWFPTIDLIKRLLEESKFSHYVFYLYHDVHGKKNKKDIDHTQGYIQRTEENGETDRSIILDAFKTVDGIKLWEKK